MLLLVSALTESTLISTDCCRGNGQLQAAQHKRSEAQRGSNVSLEMLDVLQRKHQQDCHTAMAYSYWCERRGRESRNTEDMERHLAQIRRASDSRAWHYFAVILRSRRLFHRLAFVRWRDGVRAKHGSLVPADHCKAFRAYLVMKREDKI